MTVERILSKMEFPFCIIVFVSYLTRKNILGDFIMKNTVKLEQFVALKEKDLQEIQGGESRLPKIRFDFIFPRKK